MDPCWRIWAYVESSRAKQKRATYTKVNFWTPGMEWYCESKATQKYDQWNWVARMDTTIPLDAAPPSLLFTSFQRREVWRKSGCVFWGSSFFFEWGCHDFGHLVKIIEWLICPTNKCTCHSKLRGPINWLIYLINQLKIVMKQLHNDCHFIFSRGFGSYLCVWPWSSKVINACFCRMFILTLNIYWKKLISSVLFGRF